MTLRTVSSDRLVDGAKLEAIVTSGDGSLFLANDGTYSAPTQSVESVNGHTGIVVLDKSDVGLSNVDNTSDISKPISTATQTALNSKVDTTTTVNGQALSSNVTLTTDNVSEGTAKYDKVVSLLAWAGIGVTGTYPNFTVTNSSPDEVVTLTAGTNVIITWTYPNFTISSTSGSSGTVTNVTSANADIGVATGTTTPVLTLNSGTGENQIVKLDSIARLPAVDWSQLTNLPVPAWVVPYTWATQNVNLGANSITAVNLNWTLSGTSSGTNTGDQTITLTGDATGSGTDSFAVTLANTAVTPWSYTATNLTVDSKGRITAASNGSGGSGTVTSASVVSANGLAGSVANATTTPAITLSTTVTWVLKGNGTAISAASTTGSGNVVLATSPTLVTPALGTPTSGNLTNCTADGTNKVGFLNIPQNSKSANYTTVLADGGKHIYHPSADTTARTYTIPSNASVAYPVGTAITFVNDTSAGVITIAITTDTLILAGAWTTGSRTLAANGIATAIKVTSTRWMISGTNLT